MQAALPLHFRLKAFARRCNGLYYAVSGKISVDTQNFLPFIGLFGFVVTLGLYVYEIFGIMKWTALTMTGKDMEARLGCAIYSGIVTNTQNPDGTPNPGRFWNMRLFVQENGQRGCTGWLATEIRNP
jgi:hypothetical protein